MQRQNSMYKIRRLNCSTSSVHSGIKSFSKRRIANLLRGIFSNRFATFTSRSTKVPIPPRYYFPPLLVIVIPFCRGHPHIRCATSPAIIQTRLLTYTMSIPPRPYLAQPPFMLMTTFSLCHCSTMSYLFWYRVTLAITRQRKAFASHSFHQIQQPPLVEPGTLTQCPLRSSKHRHLLLFAYILFLPRTTQLSWRLVMHQRSHLQLRLSPRSTISSLQVHPSLR